jgi:hypothetical protein
VAHSDRFAGNDAMFYRKQLQPRSACASMIS